MNDEFSELVSLSWMALGQTDGRALPADAETVRFFSSGAPKQPPIKKPSEMPAAVPPEPPSAVEEKAPTQTRRLEKLLPRPSACAASDTTDLRKQVLAKAEGLSDIPLYKDPPKNTGPKQWTLFTHITPATPHEAFVHSVAKAIGERLQVRLVEHICTSPLFALELPMAVDESEVVLLVVDAHLESSLQELLDPIHSYAPSTDILEPPFSVMGSINGKPLRTLVLHLRAHEDQTIKAQLWQSLKALATLASPY